jgi:glycosyltransferase involved in cell wall biosynthesis
MHGDNPAMNKATVLQALMQLDIGGAETHVIELSRHLADLGYRVLVASNGGCYAGRLADYGIPHYQVPLHDTKPSYLWRSCWALRRIVREEQVDIVHAHARIPAFVTAVMGRPRAFRFVTSAHGNFKGLRSVSRWGERTIAVSEDIRSYLISYFRVPAERIVVIPNGVDTDLFRPPAEGAGATERGETARIVMVSRLDGPLAEVAVRLIDACEQVYDRWPLRLEIVGDGDGISAVTSRAAACNRRRGKDVVSTLGARTDVYRIMAAGDLVVGVSRVALEAMSCSRPVILAGSQGFGGLLEVDGIERFQQDNFTARSQNAAATVPALVAALEAFFAKPPEWRRSTGERLRELVIAEYSSRRMAEKVAAVYEELLTGRKPEAG